MKPAQKSAAMLALLFLIVPLFLLVSQWGGLTPTWRAGATAALLLTTIFVYRFHILLAAVDKRRRDGKED